ncbi:MAG TPA: IS3 family transposase [Sulfurovum sp.]|nr:IS3 family transposase [Sulfurovum sp.]
MSYSLSTETHLTKRQGKIRIDYALSVQRQCELLGLKRATFYYKNIIKEYDDKLIDEIIKIQEEIPTYGNRRVTVEVQNRGFNVGREVVKKLRDMLGFKAIYTMPKTTQRNHEHKVYPYLLRDLEINRVNQVWSTDITYIPTGKGFIYLAAVIDWYSKKILSYRVSNSMDKSFCLEVLNDALQRYPKPEIFNTDQGSQYTSNEHTEILKKHQIKISMDGKGRATDNIAIERFWRTIKYEDLYINEYKNVKEIK